MTRTLYQSRNCTITSDQRYPIGSLASSEPTFHIHTFSKLAVLLPWQAAQDMVHRPWSSKITKSPTRERPRVEGH